MAEAGLFIGWGQPVRGRETKGIGVFNEALGFHGKQQEAGEIESFEVVLIGLHGGDLYGFILVKGSEQQIAALRANEEFQRLMTRAAQVVERMGVVDAAVDEGVGESVAMYQDAVKDLA
jgi:hypothetical protein